MTTELLSLEHRNTNQNKDSALKSDVSQMLVMQKWKMQSLPVDNLLTFRLVMETWYLVYNLWLLWCLFLIVNLNTAGTKTQETAYICEWFEVGRPTLDLDLLRWEDLPKSGSYLWPKLLQWKWKKDALALPACPSSNWQVHSFKWN